MMEELNTIEWNLCDRTLIQIKLMPWKTHVWSCPTRLWPWSDNPFFCNLSTWITATTTKVTSPPFSTFKQLNLVFLNFLDMVNNSLPVDSDIIQQHQCFPQKKYYAYCMWEF